MSIIRGFSILKVMREDRLSVSTNRTCCTGGHVLDQRCPSDSSHQPHVAARHVA